MVGTRRLVQMYEYRGVRAATLAIARTCESRYIEKANFKTHIPDYLLATLYSFLYKYPFARPPQTCSSTACSSRELYLKAFRLGLRCLEDVNLTAADRYISDALLMGIFPQPIITTYHLLSRGWPRFLIVGYVSSQVSSFTITHN